MKIAAAQIDCTVGDIAANTRKLCDFARLAKAAGADWVVLPEMADTGYVMSVIRECATGWEEGVVPALRACAREHSLGIVCGVAERTEAGLYNTQVVIDAQGEIISRYRKAHLYSPAPTEEHKCFAPGAERSSFVADGLRIGLSICYDLRFPELYRALACDDGAAVLLVSSAWPFPRAEHLRVLATARAIENQSYLVLANRVGTDDGNTLCGGSAIIDPYGVVLAAASADREELIVAEVSDEVLRAVRDRMPVFADRRLELYR